jgi:probable selenium-dependent hydroxylase accessory protein YqeC
MDEWYSAGALLGLPGEVPAYVAVVGCGGKTTFIESLARECRHKKALITPTAKIGPRGENVDILRVTLEDCLAHEPINGIQCLGILNEATGKLESLPEKILEDMIRHYDVVLMEADGSRVLPCKGWQDGEPVVPPYCTHTAGIVTLNALGKPADEDSVLRLPEFLQLTGLCRGDGITLEALTAMACARDGMFRNAVGRQSLFVNQVEDEAAAAVAEKWLADIQKAHPRRFDCLAYGSARANSWSIIHNI